MNTHFHDPREFARSLQQILVSNSKKIGFLAGAGTSMVRDRPMSGGKMESLVCGTKEMMDRLKKGLFQMKNYKKAVLSIEEELKSEGKNFTVEALISKISQKESVVGSEKLCGLDKAGFLDLKQRIESEIKSFVSVHAIMDKDTWLNTHSKFAEWIGDGYRKHCVEIFTTNYDYLFEIAFEKYNMPYFDGFVGSFTPSFHSLSVEEDNLLPKWTKLWKIHGSLGWEYDENSKKFIRGKQNAGSIVVYPSIYKYDKSKKQPYVSFLDRLNRFAKMDDAILLICGYAFGDEHINDTILNALAKSHTSSAIAFMYDEFDETSEIVQLAKQEPRLSIYGRRNAVIGRKFGSWKLKNPPSQDDDIQISSYFDQDSPMPKDSEGFAEDIESVYEGDFTLVDFTKLVLFLSEMNSNR